MIELLDYRKNKQKLRTPGKIVTPEMVADPEFITNLEQMKAILAKDGVGLAAVQINWGIQLFMLCIDEHSNPVSPEIFLNPKILNKSKHKNKASEGCLSLPQLYLNIIRPETITLEYTKLDGTKNTIDASGFYARAIQHETDHCLGRVFIDHASAVQMLQVKRWLDS
jgi:peptide deformylase